MKHVTILAAVMGSLFLGACSGSTEPTNETKPLRLQGMVDGCKNVQQVCTESEPPTCYDYCADEDPGQGSGDCTPIAGAYETCSDTPCAVVVNAQGQTYEICYAADCAVSFDVETKVETITCPPGSIPGGPGGSEPGNPGTGGGNDPGSSDPGLPGSGGAEGL